MVKRVTGIIRSRIYPLGTKDLRNSQLETVKRANPRASFINRNEPKVAFIAEYEEQLSDLGGLFLRLSTETHLNGQTSLSQFLTSHSSHKSKASSSNKPNSSAISYTSDLSSGVSESEITQENEKILFSAYQLIFHAKLEKLKGSITKFPSVFLSYSWDNEEHITLVIDLSIDLEKVGFTVEYDRKTNRPGGKYNLNQHINKILAVDKVILVGSPGLKEKYAEEKGTISQEINILRTRIKNKGLIGVIPLWFTGDIKDNFPEPLLHLPGRILERGPLINAAYFTHFFELLIDIFHMEENGAGIVEDIKDKKQSFIRQKNISERMLEQYGALQLEHLQAVEAQDREELAEILGLNEDVKVRREQKRVSILGLDEEGKGIAQDYAEAVKWYQKAAAQGYAEAQFDLGVMYEHGRGGLPQDYAEALKWYKLAAVQGNASAQYILGAIYAQGRGGFTKSDMRR